MRALLLPALLLAAPSLARADGCEPTAHGFDDAPLFKVTPSSFDVSGVVNHEWRFDGGYMPDDYWTYLAYWGIKDEIWKKANTGSGGFEAKVERWWNAQTADTEKLEEFLGRASKQFEDDRALYKEAKDAYKKTHAACQDRLAGSAETRAFAKAALEWRGIDHRVKSRTGNLQMLRLGIFLKKGRAYAVSARVVLNAYDDDVERWIEEFEAKFGRLADATRAGAARRTPAPGRDLAARLRASSSTAATMALLSEKLDGARRRADAAGLALAITTRAAPGGEIEYWAEYRSKTSSTAAGVRISTARPLSMLKLEPVEGPLASRVDRMVAQIENGKEGRAAFGRADAAAQGLQDPELRNTALLKHIGPGPLAEAKGCFDKTPYSTNQQLSKAERERLERERAALLSGEDMECRKKHAEEYRKFEEAMQAHFARSALGASTAAPTMEGLAPNYVACVRRKLRLIEAQGALHAQAVKNLKKTSQNWRDARDRLAIYKSALEAKVRSLSQFETEAWKSNRKRQYRLQRKDPAEVDRLVAKVQALKLAVEADLGQIEKDLDAIEEGYNDFMKRTGSSVGKGVVQAGFTDTAGATQMVDQRLKRQKAAEIKALAQAGLQAA